jgi:flagellar FliL protein
MSEEKNEAAAAAPVSASGGGNSKLTVILTIVNTVVSVAVIGLLFTSLQKEKKTQRIEDIVVEEGENAEGGGGGHGAPAPAGGHGAPAGGHRGADAHGAKKLAGFGKMVTLEQFTVNLTTPGSTTPKYVRVNISLEVPSDDVETELTQRMPQVRNAIIDLFNSKRPSDVVSEEGRQYLKEEIRSALNGFMVSGKVKGVFFTNFALSG